MISNKATLKQNLSFVDVFCIASGSMISAGIFILPGLAYAAAGPAIVLSYLLAGLLALTGMFAQAELVSAMPKAGGTYFYVTRSLGPAIGTIDGLITWFSLSLKSAFALVGMAAFVALLVPYDTRVVGIVLTLFFISMNLLGIKEASRVQIVNVFFLFAFLIYYIVFGCVHVDVHHFVPFMPFGFSEVVATAGFVFVSFGGLLKVASIAEEVRNPGTIVPRGMMASIAIVMLIYLLVVFVTTGVLQGEYLSKSLTPISDAASQFMGKPGVLIMSIGAILAFVSTANAGIMASSRYLLALSRDALLPALIGKVGEKRGIPYVAVLLTGGIIIVSLFLKLEILVKLTSTVLILTYIFSCLSVIILRESRLQNYQPQFRTPLYPWLQLVGIVGFCFLLYKNGLRPLAISIVFIIVGFLFYWFYGRIRSNREYALLHLIERITAKELTSRFLETELKEIIQERDRIEKDRFDTIIENCHVIDIKESLSMEAFFRIVADETSSTLNIDSEMMMQKLLKREKESTTVIAPMIAIPHIIIEGEKTFDIFLARCKDGIIFAGNEQPVKAVFVLVGTQDERNYHLRALAAIAQIMQDTQFLKKWISARGKEALRDIVLLGKRRR